MDKHNGWDGIETQARMVLEWTLNSPEMIQEFERRLIARNRQKTREDRLERAFQQLDNLLQI